MHTLPHQKEARARLATIQNTITNLNAHPQKHKAASSIQYAARLNRVYSHRLGFPGALIVRVLQPSQSFFRRARGHISSVLIMDLERTHSASLVPSLLMRFFSLRARLSSSHVLDGRGWMDAPTVFLQQHFMIFHPGYHLPYQLAVYVTFRMPIIYIPTKQDHSPLDKSIKTGTTNKQAWRLKALSGTVPVPSKTSLKR